MRRAGVKGAAEAAEYLIEWRSRPDSNEDVSTMQSPPATSRFPTNQGVADMRKIALLLAVLSAIVLPALYAASAHAAGQHGWVSHGGIDSNACTTAAPCATFNRALSQIGDGEEVGCLDSGSFESVTITISVTIDCYGTLAIPHSDTGGSCGPSISINAPGKVVTLRGLDVRGLIGSCETDGILIQAATAVYIEDCIVESSAQKGIVDTRTTGLTKLVIKNTVVRNNTSAGIVAAAAAKNSVVLENVLSVGNTYGLAVATGNNVVVSRSVMSENSIAGIEADPGAEVYVESTKISHNVSYGVFALGTIALANSDITFNTSSISGSTVSYGNNRLFGNGGGTAPTPVGATSTDFGQQ
jgi:hypothetical protein